MPTMVITETVVYRKLVLLTGKHFVEVHDLGRAEDDGDDVDDDDDDDDKHNDNGSDVDDGDDDDGNADDGDNGAH